MKNLVCFLLLLTGCSESAELSAMKAALEITGEKVVAKQDQSLTILRDNTTALAAIKSQIETIKIQSETLKSQEVIESNPEPQVAAKANPSQPLKPVASPPAVRLQFYTQDRCSDCKIQEPKSQEAADDLGVMLEVFDVKKHDEAFTKAGITVTPTTLIVIDDKIRVRFVGVVSSQIIVDRVAEELGKETTGGEPVGSIFPIPRQSAIVSSGNTFRPAAQRSRFVGRSRVKTRKSCPASGCPRG